MVLGLPAIVPSNHLTLESSLPTQSIERLFTIAQWFALLGSACRNIAVTVRRERRWTTAGDKPARELDRSTR